MKIWERLISLLSGIILLVITGIFALLGWGQADFIGFITKEMTSLTGQEKLWAYGMALVCLLLAIFTIRMSLRIRRREKTVINQTQYGEIQITLSAIENLALRAVRKIKGVKDAHIGIRADLTGLDIFIEISVNPDLSIPQISEEIRTKVDEYVFETTGIRVNTVKVLVTKVAGELKARVE
jgi:uncharacterized alkaline shock family protein YloU